MKATILACDPGQSGGIAWCHPNGKPACEPMPETDMDAVELIKSIYKGSDLLYAYPVCYIESVHSMPKQGVASSFKFGRNFGFLMGVITTLGFRIELITPQKWTKTLGLGSRSKCASPTEWKNRLKQSAQRKFPDLKITLKTADALLILDYAMRNGGGQ